MSSAPPKNFPPTKTRGTEDPPVICKNKKSSSEHSLVHELLKITLDSTSVLHSSLDDIVRLMITWIPIFSIDYLFHLSLYCVHVVPEVDFKPLDFVRVETVTVKHLCYRHYGPMEMLN